MDAKFLSKAARNACKMLHFTPREFEPLNADKPDGWTDGMPVYPVLRIWNSKREITLDNIDLAVAENYE